MTPLSEEIIEIIADIPRGKVATYGGIAAWAGNPRGARQVARILHGCSEIEGLPWWRVVNARGMISLPTGEGFDEQRARLAAEGVVFDEGNRIDLKRFSWESDWMEDVE